MLENVSVGIRHQRILENINWQINRGEHWIITGGMSAGKTTLARALRRELRLFSGQIHFPLLPPGAGFDAIRQAIQLVSFSDTSKLFRSVNAVHYYQQRYNAFDSDGHLTVRAYLTAGGLEETNPEHQLVLAQTGLTPLLHLERIKLSSGQTRKMLIAKAILKKPRVLILDNPYLGLDEPSRRVFNDFIDYLAGEKGMTIILAGHHQELPNCINRRFYLEKEEGQEENQADLARIQDYFRANKPAEPFKAVVQMEKVNIAYGNKTVLRDFSWLVKPGEKWALLGDNGSGKSTILSLIYADNPKAYANQVFLFDRKRGSGESIWEVKARIGFTSSELHAYFDHNFPARDVVLTGIWDGFIVRQPADSRQQKLIEGMFNYFGLSHLLDAPYQTLSTGVQRLLFFMRALVKAPALLLLDEPFQGLDAATVEKCRRLLDEVLTERHTLIFITHYREEIPASVDQILQLQ